MRILVGLKEGDYLRPMQIDTTELDLIKESLIERFAQSRIIFITATGHRWDGFLKKPCYTFRRVPVRDFDKEWNDAFVVRVVEPSTKQIHPTSADYRAGFKAGKESVSAALNSFLNHSVFKPTPGQTDQ